MALPLSERRVMEVFWKGGPMRARDAANQLKDVCTWSKTTSYTMLTRCCNKGYLRRVDPGFQCEILLEQQTCARAETQELLDHHFNGSAAELVADLIAQNKLTEAEVKAIFEKAAQE